LNVRQASQAERGNLEADLLAATRHLQNEARSLQFQHEQAQQLANRFAPREEIKKLDAAIAEQQAQLAPPPVMNKLPLASAEGSGSGGGRRFGRRKSPPVEGGIEVDSVAITFPLPDNDDVLPLSWKLSEFDKQRIDSAWTKLLAAPPSEMNPMVKLDKYFTSNRMRSARREEAQPQ
jgi:hypothetical protein